MSTKGAARKNTPINLGPLDIGNELKKAVQYHQTGKLPEAEKIYRKILTVDPNHSDSLHLLGLIAHQAGKSLTAVELIHKAIRKRPHNPVYYNNLGNVLKDQGRLDDAVSCFQKALRLNPDAAETCINLGNALKFQGKIETAEAIYRKALSIKPDFISAYYNLAQLKAFGENDEAFKTLDSIQKNRNLSAKETVEIHFTLGKMYADSGDHDRAFQNYYAGNEFNKKFREPAFNLDHFEKQISLYINTFDSDFFTRKKDCGVETELPVFIIGMPRSGTTLVEQILSSHPHVFGAGELSFINQMINTLFQQNIGLSFSEILQTLDLRIVKHFADQYLNRLCASFKGAMRITDKLPGNFLNLWFIALLFPNVKIVHCRRHPVDTCLSCYFTNFDRDLGYTYDLKTLGLYYRQYQRLMTHWHQVLPAPVLDVQYEELVENQVAVSRKMVKFCGVEWDDHCLEFYKNDRPVETASGVQVRRKIYSTAVGRWKNYENRLTPLIEALG